MGTGSFKGWLFGYNTLSGFGEEFVSFGNSLNDFYVSISGIDTTVFGRISAAINILTTIDVVNLDPVLTNLQSLMDTIYIIGNANPENISTVAEALTAFTSVGLEEMAETFKDTELVSDAIDTMIINISSSLSDKQKDLETEASGLVKAFIDKIKKELDGQDKVFNSTIDSMLSQIKAYQSGFGVAGALLVAGFKNGITANTWRAAAAAKAMAKAAEDAANKELEINSPSKKFYATGSGTVEGMVMAMYDGIKTVYSAGTKLAEAAHKGTSEAIKKVADFVSFGMDTQPTIRPVLDLTDVASGFSQLNTMFGHRQAVGISAKMNEITAAKFNSDGTVVGTGPSYNFVQNNYSPKPLNAGEIYRQTRNQFARVKGRIGS